MGDAVSCTDFFVIATGANPRQTKAIAGGDRGQAPLATTRGARRGRARRRVDPDRLHRRRRARLHAGGARFLPPRERCGATFPVWTSARRAVDADGERSRQVRTSGGERSHGQAGRSGVRRGWSSRWRSRSWPRGRSSASPRTVNEADMLQLINHARTQRGLAPAARERGPEPRRPGSLARHDAPSLLLSRVAGRRELRRSRAPRRLFDERLSLLGGLRGDRLGHESRRHAARRLQVLDEVSPIIARSSSAGAGATWASAASPARSTVHPGRGCTRSTWGAAAIA